MKPTDAERDPAFDRLIARGLATETDASGVACPDADLLAAWYDHSLSPSEAGRIESHAASCANCQQILGDLARSEPDVTRAAPLPAPSRPWHWHWRWLVPLATTALVVVVAERTLRAPGETPATVAIGEESGRQDAPKIAALQEDARRAQALKRTEGESPRAVQESPPAGAPRVSEDRQAAAARAADVPPPSPAAAPRPEEAKLEARPVGGVTGGVVGGVVGGVAKARGEAAAENFAAAAPPAAPQPAAARTAAVHQTAVTPLRSTSASGPLGATVTWRYGPGGVIERSTDRGRTWERQQSGVTAALTDGSAASDRVCWIVGERGIVLRTIDGLTWQRLSPPTSADLVSVHAWSESSARVTASDRSEYETTDGGRSWRQREPPRPLLP